MNEKIDIREIPYPSTWEIRQQVMWPEKPLAFVKLSKDKEGLHLGLFSQDRLVSIVSAFVFDGEAQFRKFATLQEEQGKGYGSQLLTYLFTKLATLNVQKIWCNARVDKASFYERFGLVKTERYFSRGKIRYVIMERELTAS